MKLGTIADGSRDGRLVVVSSDFQRAVRAEGIATSLQEAIERWSHVEQNLRSLADGLAAGSANGFFDFGDRPMAPLPRAWQWLDASTYESHLDLMATAFGIAKPAQDRPLIYQGVSDRFYGPRDDVPFVSEAHGIDFEGEFAVIVDDVPMGVTQEQARSHIVLLVQVNDWSLRALAPAEFKTGFGWLHAKPPCSLAPVAVTPDELGDAWRDGRPGLTLEIDWNGKRFGAANGYPMSYSFPELIAYAAQTRPLSAGTIVGGGTVSNDNFREVGSSCIGERRGIEMLDLGEARTSYMRFGDTIRMEARTPDGKPLFGAIDSRVVAA
jgi:fumarylacetoacetate (FAA) hydrolase